jgi:Replication-relaxation
MSRPALAYLADQLSPRDLAVVASLAELRFLSTRQLERWHYSGATPLGRARAARRGLERLTALGVLTRLDRRIGGVRAGSAGYVYALDLVGQRIATGYGWLPARRTRRLRQPGRTFLLHTLAIGELHIRLIESARAGTIEDLLVRESEPACWRSFAGPGGSRLTLKPDSFFVVATALEWSWFVEIDQDTEGSTAIERKLAAYVSYWRTAREVAMRGVQPRTLWLAPNARRVGQLEAAIGRLPLETRPLFVVAEFDQAVRVVTND